MKIKTLILFTIFSVSLFAQSPFLINYQGAARLADGTPLDNRTLSIKFELRQGSSGGNIVATEIQTVQTNLLGLFSTQIGKTTNISNINWQANLMFLQVSMDTSAGTNFTSLGIQQMVSVPYAMHASSVPSSYTNNILTIGSNTFALSSTVAVSPNTSITVSGLGTVTSVGTNSFDINIPAPTFTNTGQTIITGIYPNFTVNTPTVPASAVPTIAITNTSGATSTVVSSGNSFSINVPPPTFTNSGPSTVTGTYPNYTITSPASYTSGTGIAITSGSIINTLPHVIPTIAVTTSAAAGASVTSSGNSFSLNVPAPTFTNTGQNIITGSYPNFTVNTPTIGATPLTTVSPSGIVSVLNPATNSFVVGVQSPTFTNSDQNIITGTYPNYVVNTSSVSGGTGISVASGTVITNTAPDVVVNYTNTGQTIITGTYPNFFVNTPTVAAPPTLTGAGVAIVSGAPNYVVNVATPTFTNSGPTTITGAYPNFTINSTAAASQTLTGAGIATVTGGPNYMVDVSTPVFNNIGQTIITGTYPNFSVNTPTTAGTSIALTATAAAGPSVSTVGTNSFNINIPPSTGWSTIGNIGTSTISNFVGTIDNVALMFRTNNQRSGIIDQILSNAYFGNQSGLSNTTGSLNVAYGQEALKSLTTQNRNSAFGYQSLTNNTSGNSNTGLGASTLRSNLGGSDNTAVGKDALFANVSGSSNLAFGSGALLNHASNDNNVAIGRDALNGNVNGATNVVIGNYAGYTNTGGSGNVFIGSSAGYNETGSNKFYLANTSTTSTPLMYGDFSTGNVGIGTATANAALQFNNTIAGRKIVLWEGVNNDHQVYGFGLSSNTLRYQVDAAVGNHIFYSGVNSTTSQELMRIQGNRRIGINTAVPTATFEVTGTTKLVDGTQGAGKLLTSDAAGNASWQTSTSWALLGNAGTVPGTNFIGTTDAQAFRIRTSNVERLAIAAAGNVSVGNSTLTVGLLSIDNQSVTTRDGVRITNGRDQIGAGMPLWVQATTAGQIFGTSTQGRILRLENSSLGFVDQGIDQNSSFFISRSGSYHPNADFVINTSGFIGVGTSSPNALVQLDNSVVNRKIVLYENTNNDHQYYGLGINNNTLRYQVDGVAADHVFYAATGPTTSNEIMRVKGNGLLKMGSETGTGQTAQYPSTNGGGLVMRRLFTSNTTAGEVVARTDQMTMERDGTTAGWRINRAGGSAVQVCNCMGTNAAGTSVNKAFNNLASGVTQVYTNAENIVYFRCMFGDPYAASHITEIMFTRQHTDYFWVGTVTSTFNQ